MKKAIAFLFSLLLFISLGLVAQALMDSDDLLASQQVKSLTLMADKFYGLVQEEAGQRILELSPEGQAEIFLQLGPEQALDSLATDGQTLYGFQQESGRLCRISKEGLAWQTQALDTTFFNDGRYMAGNCLPQLVQGQLVVPLTKLRSSSEFDEQDLALLDIKSGQARLLTPESAVAFAPYKEGQLLVLQAVPGKEADSFVWQLAALHLDSEKLEPLPFAMPEAFPYSKGLGALAYDTQHDRILYAQAKQVMASTTLAPFVRVGLLQFDYFSPGASTGFILKEGYAVAANGQLVSRKTDQVINIKELTIRGYMDSAIVQLLHKRRPDLLVDEIPQQMQTALQVYQRIQAGDESTDIFIVPVDSSLRALLDKGFAHSFQEQDDLVAEASRFYPALQQALFNKDGQLAAFPTQLHTLVSTANRQRWQDFFGSKPYPRTWNQLLEDNLEFAGKGPVDTAFFAYVDHEMMTKQLLQAYILRYETPGEALRFDQPLLKTALERLAQAHSLRQDVPEVNWDEGETGSDKYLIHYRGSAGNFEVPGRYFDGSDKLPPFVFEEGDQPQMAVQMQVALINPLSRNKEAALDLLRCLADRDAAPFLYYMLRPQANEPYPFPQQDYLEKVQRTKDQLAHFEEEVRQIEAGLKEAQDLIHLRNRIAWAKADLENLDSLKWMIPAEGIAAFRTLAPSMALTDRSLLLEDKAWQQLEGIIARYAQGALPLDGFLAELNNTAQLIYREQQ